MDIAYWMHVPAGDVPSALHVASAARVRGLRVTNRMGRHVRILAIHEICDAFEDSVQIPHFIILSLFLRVIKYNLNRTDTGNNIFSYVMPLIFLHLLH